MQNRSLFSGVFFAALRSLRDGNVPFSEGRKTREAFFLRGLYDLCGSIAFQDTMELPFLEPLKWLRLASPK